MWLVSTVLDSLTLEHFTVGGYIVLCYETADHVGSNPRSTDLYTSTYSPLRVILIMRAIPNTW